MTKAITAGSYDPFTYGHLDIIKRTANLFDTVIVGIGANPDKKYTFTLEEREEMVRRSLAAYFELQRKIRLVSFKGLLVDYAYENKIPVIVKGIRNQEDLDYEEDLFKIGESQRLGVETFLLPRREDMAHIRSSSAEALQKEQGKVHEYVPLYVKQCLEARLSGQYIVSITGEICAGKSYVAKKLEQLGKEKGILVHNIELDYIPHRIYDGTLKEPVYEDTRRKVIEAFGEEVALPDGTINRKALGEIVFGNPEKLERLNEIINEPMMVGLRKELRGKKGLMFINAALVAESDISYLSNNNVVLVTVDKLSQERRLEERELTKEQVERRLASQYTAERKRKAIEEEISKHVQGHLWTIDNSDNSSESDKSALLDEIVRYIDQYGELRFAGLWRRVGADGTPYAEYERLLETYSQSHRIYHTLPHIVNGLSDHEEAKHLMESSDRVLFAWWYHDFVMKEKSRVDEERSAEVAYDACRKALLPEDFADYVKDLVLTTKTHESATADGKFISDIDLSIFGKPEKEFDVYEDKIRREYSWLDSEEFRKGRIFVLEKFLKRSVIYQTDFFRRKYEEQARINIQRSLAKLEN